MPAAAHVSQRTTPRHARHAQVSIASDTATCRGRSFLARFFVEDGSLPPPFLRVTSFFVTLLAVLRFTFLSRFSCRRLCSIVFPLLRLNPAVATMC
eukprot:CAMPEP_0119374258 /NCGR_PEP_ID=MMETSP1334-20130426/30488_1 /TAXON_ID=127549 /ORGANISM="Calcidiscus leptoporus, Strain RCC1130" /LENGTH=95 /DNA_ID=CAMNT_0007392289 /DNA_START=291 /DNA_END=578 /DNA_ORIENTATION=-